MHRRERILYFPTTSSHHRLSRLTVRNYAEARGPASARYRQVPINQRESRLSKLRKRVRNYFKPEYLSSTSTDSTPMIEPLPEPINIFSLKNMQARLTSLKPIRESEIYSTNEQDKADSENLVYNRWTVDVEQAKRINRIELRKKKERKLVKQSRPSDISEPTVKFLQKITNAPSRIVERIKSLEADRRHTSLEADRNPILAYVELKERRCYGGIHMLWTIYDGLHYSKDEDCSVHVFDKRLLDNVLNRYDSEKMIRMMKKNVQYLTKYECPQFIKVLHPIEEGLHTMAYVTERIKFTLASPLAFEALRPRNENEWKPIDPYPLEIEPSPYKEQERTKQKFIRMPNYEIDYDFIELELRYGFSEIITALHFMHNTINRVHRNLSPSAIVVTKRGNWKLTNFELCTILKKYGSVQFGQHSDHLKIAGVHVDAFDKKTSYLLQSEMDFTAPEGINLGNYTQKSDLYSLGLIILAVFNGGKGLISCNRDFELFRRQACCLPHQMTHLMDIIPPTLQNVLIKLVDYDPVYRPNTKMLYHPEPEPVIKLLQIMDKPPKDVRVRARLLDKLYRQSIPFIAAKIRWTRIWPKIQDDCHVPEIQSVCFNAMLLLIPGLPYKLVVNEILPYITVIIRSYFEEEKYTPGWNYAMSNIHKVVKIFPNKQLIELALDLILGVLIMWSPLTKVKGSIICMANMFRYLKVERRRKEIIDYATDALKMHQTNLAVQKAVLTLYILMFHEMDRKQYQNEIFPLIIEKINVNDLEIVALLGQLFKRTLHTDMTNKDVEFLIRITVDRLPCSFKCDTVMRDRCHNAFKRFLLSKDPEDILTYLILNENYTLKNNLKKKVEERKARTTESSIPITITTEHEETDTEFELEMESEHEAIPENSSKLNLYSQSKYNIMRELTKRKSEISMLKYNNIPLTVMKSKHTKSKYNIRSERKSMPETKKDSYRRVESETEEDSKEKIGHWFFGKIKNEDESILRNLNENPPFGRKPGDPMPEPTMYNMSEIMRKESELEKARSFYEVYQEPPPLLPRRQVNFGSSLSRASAAIAGAAVTPSLVPSTSRLSNSRGLAPQPSTSKGKTPQLCTSKDYKPESSTSKGFTPQPSTSIGFTPQLSMSKGHTPKPSTSKGYSSHPSKSKGFTTSRQYISAHPTPPPRPAASKPSTYTAPLKSEEKDDNQDTSKPSTSTETKLPVRLSDLFKDS